jgi:aryl-alcohol dehydrogenase-like predicted oxidoreductase
MRFAPRRQLGRTGFVVTRLGAGDLADRAVPLDSCVATLARALDAGLNVVDTAPGYEDGYSEEIVGAAVAGRRRDALFVIDKIDDLRAPVAPQLDRSLARLRLPMVDLVAFHNVSTLDAWRALAAPGGAFGELAAEVRRGRARFRGLSSHHPDVLRAAIPSGLCDVVLFPIGPWVDPRYETETLPLARAHGVGTVSFKTFGAGKLLGDTEGYQRAETRLRPHLTVDECVAYTLSRDPDVALLGLSRPDEQDEAFAAAESFGAALDDAALAELRRRAGAAVDGKGRCWWNPEAAAT